MQAGCLKGSKSTNWSADVYLQGAHDVAGLEISRGHQKLGDELDLLVLRFVALYSCNVPKLPASIADCQLSKLAWRTLQLQGKPLNVSRAWHQRHCEAALHLGMPGGL